MATLGRHAQYAELPQKSDGRQYGKERVLATPASSGLLMTMRLAPMTLQIQRLRTMTPQNMSPELDNADAPDGLDAEVFKRIRITKADCMKYGHTGGCPR